jgi:hypothetical protein
LLSRLDARNRPPTHSEIEAQAKRLGAFFIGHRCVSRR